MNIKSVMFAFVFGCSLLGVQPKAQAMGKVETLSRVGIAVGCLASAYYLNTVRCILGDRKTAKACTSLDYKHELEVQNKLNAKKVAWKLPLALAVTLVSGISFKYLK